MATVYAVASAKGGVGKTTTAAAIGTLLADAGASVVAIDADLGMANLAGTLGIDAEGETIHDVLAGRVDPEAAAQEGPRGLRILPGKTDLDAYADADPAGLVDVVDSFADADYVILDAGAGLSHDSALPLEIADRTLLVSTPEREALRDTAKTGQLADRLGGTVHGAVITRVDPDDPHRHDDLIVAHLDVPIHERIPEDDAVGDAVAAGEPLVVFAPTAPATRGYRSLTERLTGLDLPEPEEDETDAPVIRDAEDDGSNGRIAGETTIDRDEIDGIAETTKDEGSAETTKDEGSAETTKDEGSAGSRGTERSPADGEPGADERTVADEDGPEPIDGIEAADGQNEPGVESVPFREGADAESTADGSNHRSERSGESDVKSGEGRDDVGGEGGSDDENTDADDGERPNGTDDDRGFFSRLFGR
ncbi:nucleotide-binding protein [Halopenitus persicus]|uniref:nucleotide-binding protein n=1 Tax=Halopenitus persicus TaxID=1048396 RepID=UPI000BBB0110|nr:P-loop NTPase [Halopenitus persicus]